MCGPTRAPGVYLLRIPSNPFLESREESKVILSPNDTRFTRRVITPAAFERHFAYREIIIKFPLGEERHRGHIVIPVER